MTELVAQLIEAAFCLSVLFFGLFLLVRLGARRQSRRQQQTAFTPTSGKARPPAVAPARAAQAPLPYMRQPNLLTAAERDFFAVLQSAAPPGWYIFPQVRLSGLLEIQLPGRSRAWWAHFNRISAKSVDFVLCDGAAISPQLIVELDDSSHNRPDRQRRDAFVDAALASAGLPILHVLWQRRYDAARLAADIRQAAGMPSPPTLLPVPTMPTPALAVSAPMRDARAAPLSPALLSLTAVAPPARMACRRCGGEVSMTARFCPGCGATLEL